MLNEGIVSQQSEFAFFGVYNFGCTHFFISGDAFMLIDLLKRADISNIREFIMSGNEPSALPTDKINAKAVKLSLTALNFIILNMI